jgi:hypothetical protein
MAKINDLQFTKMKYNGEFTDTNHLSTALLTKPEIARTVAYAFGDKYHLSYLTQGSGRVSDKYKMVGNGEFMWSLMGQLTKAVAITGDTVPARATGDVGRAFSSFTIPLEDKYFALGDKVKFGDKYTARVQEEPRQVGRSYIYTMQLITHDGSDAIPASLLEPGRSVGWAGTAFEEGSKGGSSKKATPMWFKNQMSTSRLSWGMTGSARTDVMALGMGKNKSGNQQFLWLYEEEYQQMLQWNRISEIDRWYNRYNKSSNGTVNLPGQSGRQVKQGAGLLQQLEGTNYREYSNLSEDYLRDFLTDLQIQAKDAENSHFMLMTGSEGLKQFDQALKTARIAYELVDTHFVSKHGGDLHFGNNFRSYKGLLGSTFTVAYVPMFDDATLHTEIDPDTNLPYESGRMVFLDVADYEGEANISLCAKGADGVDRSMVHWCTEGSTTYQGGEAQKRMRSNDFDGFECHYLSETSIKVINPLSCGQMVKRRA